MVRSDGFALERANHWRVLFREQQTTIDVCAGGSTCRRPPTPADAAARRRRD